MLRRRRMLAMSCGFSSAGPGGRCGTVAAARPVLAAGILLLAAAASVAAGCSDEPALYGLEGPSTIAVELAPGTSTGCGEGEELLPYGSQWIPLRMSFALLDAAGQPVTSYSGRLKLTMIPGEVLAPYVTMQEGLIEDAPVSIRRGFGRETRIWVEAVDEGGGNVAGVSTRFCFSNPRVRDTQESDRSYRSPLQNQQVLIDQGTLIITGYSQSGFYVSDIAGCRPREGWREGDAGSRLDCSAELHRDELKLTGTRATDLRTSVRIPDSAVTVHPTDDPQQAFQEGTDYELAQGDDKITITRKAEGRIPDGATVLVDWIGPALAFNSLYVYSYSAPYGVNPGTRVCMMQGGITEFLGLTELGFPSYRIFLEGGSAAAVRKRPYNDEQVPDPRDDDSYIFEECPLENPDWQGPAYVPDPIPIRGATIPGAEVPINDSRNPSANKRHMKLDPYESALVVLENVVLPSRWMSCDLDGSRMVDRCYDQDREEGRCLENQMAENDCEMACATAGKTGLRPGQRASDFAGCTELTNFGSYGQYVVEVQDLRPNGTVEAVGRINLNTRTNVPEFDPRPISKAEPYGRLYPFTDRERKVKGIRRVVGTLFQVDSARPVWQVIPRNIGDIEFEFVE